jgi:hypothetical protein
MSGAGSGGLGTLCLTLGLIPTLAGRSGPSRGCLAERSDVRINQLGYLPGSPKRATWVNDEPLPVEFSVVTADGSVALRGLTQPWPNRPEPTSGQSVHVLDFTDLAAAGPGYQLLVAGPAKPSVPNCRGPLRPHSPATPWDCSTCSDPAARSKITVPPATAGPPAIPVCHRIKATPRFPPGLDQRPRASIQDGRQPSASMCPAAGATPEITASTPSAAASPCDNCSRSSNCSKA